jgi:hypothetical protein
MNKKKAASLLGKASADARRKQWGEDEFNRRMKEWGQLGGRPKKVVPKKGGKSGTR